MFINKLFIFYLSIMCFLCSGRPPDPKHEKEIEIKFFDDKHHMGNSGDSTRRISTCKAGHWDKQVVRVQRFNSNKGQLGSLSNIQIVSLGCHTFGNHSGIRQYESFKHHSPHWIIWSNSFQHLLPKSWPKRPYKKHLKIYPPWNHTFRRCNSPWLKFAA